MGATVFVQRYRRILLVIAGLLLALLIAAFLLLSFGWTYLRRPLEQRLSSQLGRPVTIGSIRRTDHSLLQPVLVIDNVRIAQPTWVGQGDMIVVRSAIVQLPLLPLLIGKAQPRAVELDGLHVALVRRDPDHANWKNFGKGGSGGKGGGSLARLVIRDGIITLDDRKQDHRLTATLAADERGLRLAGTGSLAGHPSRIAISGAALTGRAAWPFRFDYRSAIANGTLFGRADHPLDIGHFSARATAWGDDLRHIDLLIEAGLPATQDARVTADLRHDRPDWKIDNLRLRIGRSAFAGNLLVTKRDGRTRVDGDIVSPGLDFDDLSSDEGLVLAAAKRRRLGPRLIPDTAIHLEKLRQTDAAIRFDIRHLIGDAPTVLRSLRGTLTLDHGILTARPLAIRLSRGKASGFAQVAHQSGAPTLKLDLRIAGSRVETMLGDAATGDLSARIRLQGNGNTIRAAIGHASGSIGIVGRNGTVNRRAALFLGSDAGRALFEDKGKDAVMRCLIGRFEARRGIAIASPLLLDTDVSRAQGEGTINLSDERLSMALKGQPKLAHALRLNIPIEVTGTLSDPHIVPKGVPQTVGTALKLIGKALSGPRATPAPDADCAALSARALN